MAESIPEEKPTFASLFLHGSLQCAHSCGTLSGAPRSYSGDSWVSGKHGGLIRTAE